MDDTQPVNDTGIGSRRGLGSRIESLEVCMEGLETNFKTLSFDLEEVQDKQDRMIDNQETTLKKLGELDAFLKGTEYDSNGGGFVKHTVNTLSNVKNRIRELELWKTMVKTRNWIIWLAFTSVVGFLSAVIIANWSNIFK